MSGKGGIVPTCFYSLSEDQPQKHFRLVFQILSALIGLIYWHLTWIIALIFLVFLPSRRFRHLGLAGSGPCLEYKVDCYCKGISIQKRRNLYDSQAI